MIICPHCQRQNSPRARFCAECGATFAVTEQAATVEVETVEVAAMAMREVARVNVAEVAPASAFATRTVPPGPAAYPPEPPLTAPTRLPEYEPPATTPGPLSSPPTAHDFAVPMPEAALPDAPLSGDVSLSLALNFPHVVVAGYDSLVELRLQNCSSHPLEKVQLRLESRGLKNESTARWKQLAPGQMVTVMVEIEPERPGSHVLRATLQCERNDQNLSFRGVRRFLVNKEPDARNISVSIGNIMTADGQNAGMGNEGHVSISNLISEGAIRSVNDLLNVELPEHFLPLAMELDWEISQRQFERFEEPAASQAAGFEIPASMLGEVAPSPRLRLEPVREGITLPLLFVAADSFRIGRNRAAVDYPAWFWPATDANNERTRNVGREHVLLKCEQRCVVGYAQSSSPTSFEGEPIQQGERFEISQRGVLVLGGEYQMDVSPFPSSLAGPAVPRNDRMWTGPSDTPAPSHGSVRCTPINTEQAHHRAVWIFTDATLGSSQLNTIILKLPGIAESHGRVHFRRGQFWLESFAGAQISVGTYTLRPGELAPLRAGQSVKLGGTEFRVG